MDGGVAGQPGQSALRGMEITTSQAPEHAQRFDCQLDNLLTQKYNNNNNEGAARGRLRGREHQNKEVQY